MTVNVNLPEKVEQAYAAAAWADDVSIEVLIADVLVSNAPVTESPKYCELIEEHGIPVLRSGHPLILRRPGTAI